MSTSETNSNKENTKVQNVRVACDVLFWSLTALVIGIGFGFRVSDFGFFLGFPMSTHSHLRRGLAMLELVMALPMLLFVMALIIGYGTASAWKVREHSVSRLAVWETRWPRSGAAVVRPIGPPRHRWHRPTRARCRGWTTAASICRSPAGRCRRPP